MSATSLPTPAAAEAGGPAARGSAGSGRGSGRDGGRAGYGFVAGYVALLLAFGIVPTVWALIEAFRTNDGQFAAFNNFVETAQDFRFLPAIGHIGLYLLLWLVSLVVLVVALALLLHQRANRTSDALRFVYYLPGALAGAASVLVWLFMLDPSVSPVGGLLRAFGWDNFREVIDPGNLPPLFAVIAFWTGAGGWIVIIHGALNNIPDELIEAAQIDGASRWQIAWMIQIPLLKKWIVYMVILAFAAGTQLFVEPQLVAQASLGAVSDAWSPNQLAYQFAFNYGNFGYAAAIAVDLLILGLACATVLVFRSGLFDTE
jgi:multiple sugar transport system permease protein